MPNTSKQRVLIFGATGMLGSTLFRVLSLDQRLEVFGTMRNSRGAEHFAPQLRDHLILTTDLETEPGLSSVFSITQPDIVINCIGIIKQKPSAGDYLQSLGINASLPHRLAKCCARTGSRLVHFSTDCVFSGKHGQYTEGDFADANDLYGRTKYLGEVDYGNAVTLRTSIIGHELNSARSLVDWFLSQKGKVKGFRKAIFSGLPTIEIARVISDFIVPYPQLRGLYHLSVEPINKYDLLSFIAEAYNKKVIIIPDDEVVIDRSLNSDRFQFETGFTPKPWSSMIEAMHCDYAANTFVRA